MGNGHGLRPGFLFCEAQNAGKFRQLGWDGRRWARGHLFGSIAEVPQREGPRHIFAHEGLRVPRDPASIW